VTSEKSLDSLNNRVSRLHAQQCTMKSLRQPPRFHGRRSCITPARAGNRGSGGPPSGAGRNKSCETRLHLCRELCRPIHVPATSFDKARDAVNTPSRLQHP
jgi:hypothetical protein